MKVKRITELDTERLDIAEFKSVTKTPLIVVLDNVRSLNNVGSVFRTSDAFCVEAIYLCGITAVPPNAEIHKTALGAENSVSWIYFDTTIDAVKHLKSMGFEVAAIEQVHGSVKLDELNLDTAKKYALVLGNEVKGVTQDVVDTCDFCVEIPQYGTKHSLNVAIAGGVSIWEFFKQLNT